MVFIIFHSDTRNATFGCQQHGRRRWRQNKKNNNNNNNNTNNENKTDAAGAHLDEDYD